MTLAPRLGAVLMIAAPDPGSRSTSRMTLAPLVSAWSAWLRWVLGSPCALTMVCGMPAALKAWSRYLRSWVSQRTEDCVSGSSTAILPLFELPPVVLELLLLDPQPTPMAAAAMTRAPSAHFDLTEPILLVVAPSLSFNLIARRPPWPAPATRGRRGRPRAPGRRAARRGCRARSRRARRRPPRPASRSGGPRRAWARVAGRRRARGARRRPPGRG